MSFYIRKQWNFVMTRIILFINIWLLGLKQISVKEYENLIKNKNKMYNITPQFSSPELLK